MRDLRGGQWVSAAHPEGLCRGLTFVRPLHKSFGMMAKEQGRGKVARGGPGGQVHRVPWVEGGEQGKLFTLAAQSTLCAIDWQCGLLADSPRSILTFTGLK